MSDWMLEQGEAPEPDLGEEEADGLPEPEAEEDELFVADDDGLGTTKRAPQGPLRLWRGACA
jgi:hypothetical protein